jgi:tripartite-type tricarboxylate transporter receptor subunit TctC
MSKAPQTSRRALIAGAAAALWPAAFAQQPGTYPSRPIRLITPFSPGGSTDVLSRIISEKMAPHLGQPVLVDNKPGASGMLGTALAARAAPDGYTLVNVISTHAIQHMLHKKLPYDSVNDFEPVALYARQTLAFAVHPSLPVKDAREFVAWVKASGAPFAYGTSGIGTAVHVAMESFGQAAGIPLQHVPFAGGGPAMQAGIGGHVKGVILGLSTVGPHIQNNNVRGIFVSSSQRAAEFPNLPTLRESGYPSIVKDEWWALLAPAGTPKAVVAALNAEIDRIFTASDVKSRLGKLGVDYMPSSPDKINEFIRNEAARGGEVLKAAKIEPE